jgi:hypothetical protein
MKRRSAFWRSISAFSVASVAAGDGERPASARSV